MSLAFPELILVSCIIAFLAAIIIIVAVTFAARSSTKQHNQLSGLENDDHSQYLPTSGARSMGDDLDLGGHRIQSLGAAGAHGQAVAFEQAVKNGDPAGGDLADAYPAPRVSALQGNRLANLPPKPGDVLTWDGESWAPLPIGEAPAAQETTRITAVSWAQRAVATLEISFDNANRRGLIIGFSRPVVSSSLNADTFQVFVELETVQGELQILRLPATAIVPVEISPAADGRALSGTSLPSDSQLTLGAAFLLSEAAFERLQGHKALVRLRGDFILDERGMALDGEHLGGRLPSGDGRPGGDFESWFQVSE